jgi:multisubunit Na+/H+ antiporter MnhE subunit
MFFAVMAAPLEYVRPELFDKAVDRHHRSYVSAVLGGLVGTIRCRTTRTLMSIHPWWITKYVIHIYYLFLFLYNSNCVK